MKEKGVNRRPEEEPKQAGLKGILYHSVVVTFDDSEVGSLRCRDGKGGVGPCILQTLQRELVPSRVAYEMGGVPV